jgi:7-cyano-7-deazaguanine synthase
MKTAVLLSGGMDSTAITYWRHPEIAITIDYGQRPAAAEVRAASSVADALGIEHHVIAADLSALGSGDMAGSAALPVAAVPEWWPFRNQMLITLTAMKAVALGVNRLLIGTLKTDGEGHADGRIEFVERMDQLLGLQEGGLGLEAPAINLTAVELIRASRVPMDILAWSHSCHVAEHACGLCRGCRKHYETMAELDIDPY